MARYIYTRVSTLQQDYAQQRNTIDRYLDSIRVLPAEIDGELMEKITGTKEHTTRKFAGLFAKCKQGDTIYFSELSRIGRNMRDLNNIVEDACKRGINLIQCKDGTRIEDETIAGKALLFALSLAAEIEVANLHQRVNSGVSVAMGEIKKHGKRITKRGTIQTHWGNEKGSDEAKRIMAIARDAAAQAKADAMIAWRGNSQAVRYAIRRRAEGATPNLIVAELGALYDDFAALHPDEPNPYATPKGCKPSGGTISKWLRESNPLVLAS